MAAQDPFSATSIRVPPQMRYALYHGDRGAVGPINGLSSLYLKSLRMVTILVIGLERTCEQHHDRSNAKAWGYPYRVSTASMPLHTLDIEAALVISTSLGLPCMYGGTWGKGGASVGM